jgi:hypothetical protein
MVEEKGITLLFQTTHHIAFEALIPPFPLLKHTHSTSKVPLLRIL